MNNFTFLEENQIFGPDRLDIIEKYGTTCAITDFSILLGGHVSSFQFVTEMATLKDRTSFWWTKTSYKNFARVVDEYGSRSCYVIHERTGGVRPVLPSSVISSISSNGVRDRHGILEVNYGEYPQTIVDEINSRNLEDAFNRGILTETGKPYTTDSVTCDSHNKNFMPRAHIEYEYKGKKYIRFIADGNGNGEILSDGRKVQSGQAYWVEVEPITWLIDEKANIALARKILFAGVQFSNSNYYFGDFENTLIYKFMNTHFSKDIIPSKIISLRQVSDTEHEDDKDRTQKYQIMFQKYQAQKEEMVNLQIELSEVKDKKSILEKERQIEKDHINRIDKELEELDNSQIGIAKRQMEDYENKLAKAKEKSQLPIIKNPIVLPISFFGLLNVVICALFNAPIIYALLGISSIGILLCIESQVRKSVNRNRHQLENTTEIERTKLLEATKKLKKAIIDNPNVINRIIELKQEKEETIDKIQCIDKKTNHINSEIDEITNRIHEKQSQIDELFYMLSVLEVKLLYDGIEVESVLNEESIVKKLGEYPKKEYK